MSANSYSSVSPDSFNGNDNNAPFTGGLYPDHVVPPGMSYVVKPAAHAQKTKSRARRRVNTAEKRTQHNAIERARRENLNSTFGALGRSIPALANNRRPSKAMIVNGAISHLAESRKCRLEALRICRVLLCEREQLILEVNGKRAAHKESPYMGIDVGKDMGLVTSVEHETFSVATEWDSSGIDEAGEGAEEDYVLEEAFAQSSASAIYGATPHMPVNQDTSHFDHFKGTPAHLDKCVRPAHDGDVLSCPVPAFRVVSRLQQHSQHRSDCQRPVATSQPTATHPATQRRSRTLIVEFAEP